MDNFSNNKDETRNQCIMDIVKIFTASRKSILIERLMNWLQDSNYSDELKAQTFVEYIEFTYDTRNPKRLPIIDSVHEISRLLSSVTVDEPYIKGYSKWGFDHNKDDLGDALRLTNEEKESILDLTKATFGERMSPRDFEVSALSIINNTSFNLLRRAMILWNIFTSVAKVEHDPKCSCGGSGSH